MRVCAIQSIVAVILFAFASSPLHAKQDDTSPKTLRGLLLDGATILRNWGLPATETETVLLSKSPIDPALVGKIVDVRGTWNEEGFHVVAIVPIEKPTDDETLRMAWAMRRRDHAAEAARIYEQMLSRTTDRARKLSILYEILRSAEYDRDWKQIVERCDMILALTSDKSEKQFIQERRAYASRRIGKPSLNFWSDADARNALAAESDPKKLQSSLDKLRAAVEEASDDPAALDAIVLFMAQSSHSAISTAAATYIPRLSPLAKETIFDLYLSRVKSGNPVPSEARPVIQEAARKASTPIRRKALALLRNFPSDESRAIFVDSAKDSDPTTRQAAVRGLSGYAGRETVDLLSPLLNDADARVRIDAVIALATIGNPDARKALENRMATATKEEQALIRENLRNFK